MKEMLLLCTEKFYFMFNGKTYIQTDGVATSSLLGPVLADMFMIELEKSLVPELTTYIKYILKKICGRQHLLYKNRIC